jgi:hypothetical protein
MPPKIYKWMLTAITVVMLVAVSFIERDLANEREILGITRYTELKGAPPILELTTVALGGFRGLISNILWIRANDLQENEKFFEMMQLADWITKLEPNFTQVWTVQAWNMAYNISVKFKDPQDRWRWVKAGIELLRDHGLVYNPNDVLMHRELAWFFQHKMGANMDDAHIYYKQMWANEMASVFGKEVVRPNWDEFINPKTDDQRKRAELLRNKYKMDPVIMKQVDETYGPLEWRLPEAHAIYWAVRGLNLATADGRRIDTNDLITLRRVVYQSMQLSFQRGRLVPNNADKHFEFEPNLEIIPKVSAAYEQAMDDDPKNRDHIETAHRNFLRDAVYFLYEYNRERDALKWYQYLSQKYPDKPLMENMPNSFPRNVDLDTYAINRIQGEVSDMGVDKAKGVIMGLERRAYMALAVGEDDEYTGLDNMAQKLRERYEEKIGNSKATQQRVPLPSMLAMKQDVLANLLNDEMSPALGAQLRTRLNLGTNSVATPENQPLAPITTGATNESPASATNAAPPETTIK